MWGNTKFQVSRNGERQTQIAGRIRCFSPTLAGWVRPMPLESGGAVRSRCSCFRSIKLVFETQFDRTPPSPLLPPLATNPRGACRGLRRFTTGTRPVELQTSAEPVPIVRVRPRHEYHLAPTVSCSLLPPMALCAVGKMGYWGKERGRRVGNRPDSEIELPQHPIRRVVRVRPVFASRVAHGTHACRHEILHVKRPV